MGGAQRRGSKSLGSLPFLFPGPEPEHPHSPTPHTCWDLRAPFLPCSGDLPVVTGTAQAWPLPLWSTGNRHRHARGS